jgi:hypothetical protein
MSRVQIPSPALYSAGALTPKMEPAPRRAGFCIQQEEPTVPTVRVVGPYRFFFVSIDSGEPPLERWYEFFSR